MMPLRLAPSFPRSPRPLKRCYLSTFAQVAGIPGASNFFAPENISYVWSLLQSCSLFCYYVSSYRVLLYA